MESQLAKRLRGMVVADGATLTCLAFIDEGEDERGYEERAVPEPLDDGYSRFDPVEAGRN